MKINDQVTNIFLLIITLIVAVIAPNCKKMQYRRYIHPFLTKNPILVV